jgi:hypothetical protein
LVTSTGPLLCPLAHSHLRSPHARFLSPTRPPLLCCRRYERLYPTGANGVVQQKDYNDATAPIYIISASAGNVEGLSCPHLQPKDVKPYTALFNGTDYGLGRLTVHNATNLEWSFYTSEGEHMIDRVDIVKTKRWQQLQREVETKTTWQTAMLRAE